MEWESVGWFKVLCRMSAALNQFYDPGDEIIVNWPANKLINLLLDNGTDKE